VLTANTRHEKGYGDDEVDLKVVDISERLCQPSILSLIFTADKCTTQCPCELKPYTFLRINPKGTAFRVDSSGGDNKSVN
jgi:hypothetical protein